MSDEDHSLEPEAEVLSIAADELRSIARASLRLGLDVLSEDLQAIANDLAVARKTMLDKWHKEIQRSYRDAQQASATMLSAALAGVQLSKGDANAKS